MHKHHIIPKHEWKNRFGTLVGINEKDNVVYLTVEQHSLAHKWLWEQFGKKEDYVAWMCLSGQITVEEAIKMASSRVGKLHSISTKIKISTSQKGKSHSPEHIERQRQSHIGHKRSTETKNKISLAKIGIPLSDAHKQKIKLSMIGVKHKLSESKRKIIKCPHCNKVGAGPMYRWHFNNCKEKYNEIS
jgi:hypothetical protein